MPLPSLLLIHGSLCDQRYWRWQSPAFEPEFKVLAPSLRGYWPHPLQREDPRFTITQHAEDMAALLASQTHGPAIVLGHSRGAHVALEVACRNPERVGALVLADPGFPVHSTAQVPLYLEEAAAKLRVGQVDAALEQFIDAVSGAGTWRKMVAWFKTMVRDNAYTLLSQIREADRPFALQRLAGIRCPVLLVGGEHSPPRFKERLDMLEERLPRAQRVVVPHASHGMNLGNPKAFNQAVLDFAAAIS